MKVAFICSGDPVDLKYLVENRESIEKILSPEWKIIYQDKLRDIQDLILTVKERKNKKIDEFLFFYTGHGYVCKRKKNLNLKLFYDSKITINDIIDEIIELKPKKIAIVLDACYSGNYNKVEFPENIQLLTSSNDFQQSYEFTGKDEPKNSVFSHFFCEAIKELKGKITLSDIESYVTPKLKEYFECDLLRDQKPLLVASGNNPIVIVDKTHNTPSELDHFIQQKENFLNSVQNTTFNCSKNEFSQCIETYVSNQTYLDKVKAQESIQEMINTLYDSSQKEDLASILKEMSQSIEFDIYLETWINEYYNPDNEKVTREQEELDSKQDRIYVIMKHLQASTYEVMIFPRYVKGSDPQDNFTIDINLVDSQALFVRKFRSLRDEIPIHLIVPEEFYLENIRVWLNRRRSLLDYANPLYLHSFERYSMSSDNYEDMITKWDNYFQKDKTLDNSLALLKSSEDSFSGRDEEGNRLLGVCYQYQPTDIDEIYDPLDKAFVSLWSHDTQVAYKTHIIDKFDTLTIDKLPQKLNQCQHISLLWDNMRLLEDFKREYEQ